MNLKIIGQKTLVLEREVLEIILSNSIAATFLCLLHQGPFT